MLRLLSRPLAGRAARRLQGATTLGLLTRPRLLCDTLRWCALPKASGEQRAFAEEVGQPACLYAAGKSVNLASAFAI